MEERIIIKLQNIFKEYFGLEIELDEQMNEMPLTAIPFGMSGFDMYRLLMILETEFLVKINSCEIKKSGFHTINEIVAVIKGAM